MALDTPFVRFLRSGGKSEFTVNLQHLHRSLERKDTSLNLTPYFRRFLEFLEDAEVIPPFLTGLSRRIHAAVFSFIAGVIPPMAMLGRSWL